MALPGVISLIGWLSARCSFREQRELILLGSLCTAVQALPAIQAPLSLLGHPGDLHAMPVFLLLYLMLGRFESLSLRVAFGGTFLSLLLTDLVGATVCTNADLGALGDCLYSIGGGGWADGLLLLPAGAAIAAIVVKVAARRGCLVFVLLATREQRPLRPLDQKGPG